MDEKLKIFWNLDVLVKMCRSKSDGPSLRVEEEEILEKIKTNGQEVEEIRSILDDDTYDMSAEMADRNIEIITKKQLQSLKSELKEKNKVLNGLKDKEKTLYGDTSLLRENKESNEKYIASMQERLGETTDREILDRYNALITETLTEVNKLSEALKEENQIYESIQNDILQASADIEDLEERIDKKKKLLFETQTNLESKENYIDKAKKEKNAKKIEEIEAETKALQERLEEIRKDPKYIETKIKDIINSKEDRENAREYLSALVKIVIDQPYINVPADNSLEEELLRATQARDSFANEIDQKSYNILEANTPEKVRTEFLNKRIEAWRQELNRLHAEVEKVDKDEQFDYEGCNNQIAIMIKALKSDLREYEKAYNDTPENNIGLKASLEVALEEKREDIAEAENIANLFRSNEASDISNATRTIKYQCEELNANIAEAEEEIKKIRNRLMSKKSGLIDIASRNRDKDILRELAQTVIDIKHRRQFPETPLDIITRLEEELDYKILDEDDYNKINSTNRINNIDFEEIIESKYETPAEEEELTVDDDRTPNLEEFQRLADRALGNDEDEELFQELAEITGDDFEDEPVEIEPIPIEEPSYEEPVEQQPVVEPVAVPEQPVMEQPVPQPVPAPVEEVVEEDPTAAENDFSINSMFNNPDDMDNEEGNMEVKNQLTNELDSYVNNLDANQ